MPVTAKRSSSKSKTRTKAKTGTRITSKTKRSTSVKSPTKPTTSHRKTIDTTYVYECTQPECNYRIVRDEKGEEGERRNDLKCPKCHRQEFRCLGPGDLTDQPHHVPMIEVDFGAFKTIGLGAN